MEVDYEQLKTILMVADLRSFTKAGEFLHITQSTVTTRIKRVEHFLGVQLFDRSNREIQLSEKGIELLPLLKQQLSMYEKAKEVARKKEHVTEHIKITATYSIWESFNLSNTIHLPKQEPSLFLEFETDHSPFIVQNVLNGSTDYGLVYNFPITNQLDSIFIDREEYVLFRHIECEINDSFTLTDIVDYNWVFINWGYAFKKWLEDNELSELQPTMEVSYGELGMRLVNELKGMAFLPKEMVKRSALAPNFIPVTSKKAWAYQDIYGIYLRKTAKKENHPYILNLLVGEG